MKDVIFFAKLEKIKTNREAYKALNQQRECEGFSVGYDESAFFCLVAEIDDLIKEYQISMVNK
ncbi:MAG: hypothetical protein GWP19_03885 [Planctomycetia bacterium]|nr:hypothetical protein [Planctomycetia bacterium]